MRKTKYTVKATTQFKKDYKLAIKRGLKINRLEDVIAALAMGEALPEKNKDHALTGDWAGHRECHIQPDWLLVYRVEDDILVLTLARTGTHSDLFRKNKNGGRITASSVSLSGSICQALLPAARGSRVIPAVSAPLRFPCSFYETGSLAEARL